MSTPLKISLPLVIFVASDVLFAILSIKVYPILYLVDLTHFSLENVSVVPERTVSIYWNVHVKNTHIRMSTFSICMYKEITSE